MKKNPKCPKCGNRPEPTKTMYGIRHQCCGLHSWRGAPLVSKETHTARRLAHEAFDPLWKKHGLSRTEAYVFLQVALGLSEKECHMKKMDKETAEKVPLIAKYIKRELGFEEKSSSTGKR